MELNYINQTLSFGINDKRFKHFAIIDKTERYKTYANIYSRSCQINIIDLRIISQNILHIMILKSPQKNVHRIIVPKSKQKSLKILLLQYQNKKNSKILLFQHQNKKELMILEMRLLQY